MNRDDESMGFEAEVFIPLSRQMAMRKPDLSGEGLRSSRVSDPDSDIHCRQSPAALRSRLLHVRSYRPANWMTAEGVAKKRRAIEARGLPGMNKWRFITLTLSRDLFEDCPLAGYLAGKAHMRRFMKKCRDAGLWSAADKWAWKMEFQTDGWVHWHLLVSRKRKFTGEEMDTISRLWSLGRVNNEMIREDGFLYTFKYAFKAVQQVEEGEGDADTGVAYAPDWFLDFHGSKEVSVAWNDPDGCPRSAQVLKPFTFARVRFWQTSKGFYTKEDPAPERVEKAQESWSVPCPVRDHVARLSSTVQVVARDSGGCYVASSVFQLSCSTGPFWDLVGWHTVHGAAVGLGVNSYAIPAYVLKSKLANTCHLQPLLHRNRLTHLGALRAQQQRRTLATC